MNEQQLASLCKKRDKNALKLIYERYAPWMMGIAMRYTANEEHSKDILHDSFVKIFESMDRFEYQGVGSLKAWISRIVINTALTLLRKESNWSLMDKHDMEVNSTNATDEETIELYSQVSNEVIIEFIGKLPARLRAIFNLYYFDDMPHSDIAQQLGISESASRVRLHRAKSILATGISDYIKNKEL